MTREAWRELHRLLTERVALIRRVSDTPMADAAVQELLRTKRLMQRILARKRKARKAA